MEIKLKCPVCLCDTFEKGEENKYICSSCGTHCLPNDMVVCGEFYVYRFVCDDWGGVPFYVGKGSGDRKDSTSQRSQHIQNICKRYNWHSEIVKYCETEQGSLEAERDIKQQYRDYGYPLIDGELEPHAYAQRMGIEKAKALGKHLGRPKARKPDDWENILARWHNGEITAKAAMEMAGMQSTTFYKYAKELAIS